MIATSRFSRICKLNLKFHFVGVQKEKYYHFSKVNNKSQTKTHRKEKKWLIHAKRKTFVFKTRKFLTSQPQKVK